MTLDFLYITTELSSEFFRLEKLDGFKILAEIFKNSFVAVCSHNKDAVFSC